MNLAEMIGLVRSDLKDIGEPFRWSDGDLERHLLHTVADFSEAVPCEQKVTFSTIAGSRDISVSSISGLVMVEAVEFPIGENPRRLQPFTLWANVLSLTGEDVPDGSAVNLYYGVIHILDDSTSTIPEKYEDIIVCGAAGYAAVEMAAFTINRINTGGLNTPANFLNWGNGKLAYFRSELKRLGYRNKLRVHRLYTL